MTGKFHHLWGEVGGYKKPEALLYECGAMLAQGAKCSIGDHLHPTGALDQTTYRTIAGAYAHVKDCEPWAEGSVNRAEIAVLSAEAASRPRLAGIPGHHVDADEGVVRLLLEGKFTFDLLDLDSDFTRYRLVILPDVIEVSPKLKTKVAAFAKDGGRVLLTGRSGIDPKKGFVFDVGADWRGPSPYKEGDYLLPAKELRASFVDDPAFHVRGGGADRSEVGTLARRHLRPLFRSRRQALQRPRQHAEPAGPVRLRRRVGERRLHLHGASRSSPPTSGSAPSPCWRSPRRSWRMRSAGRA